jgi:hypothetical protein
MIEAGRCEASLISLTTIVNRSGTTTEIKRGDAGRCHPFYVGGIEDGTLTSATRTLLFKIDHFA